MRFLPTKLKNEPQECAQLRHGLFLLDPPPFKAFVQSGTDDAPVRFDLYVNQRPEYNERPVAVYEKREGVFVRADMPPSLNERQEISRLHRVGQVKPPVIEVSLKEIQDRIADEVIDEVIAATPPKPLTLVERLKLKGVK